MRTFCTLVTNKDLNIKYEGPKFSKEDWDDADLFILNMNYCLDRAGANVRFDLDGEFIEELYD